MNELFRRLLFLPPQSSTVARSIDTLHYAVIATTMVGATLVFLVGVFFVIRYRAGDRPFRGTPALHAPAWLEVGFIVAMLALFIASWQIGFGQLLRLGTPPADAIDIYVSAKQWMWRFSYPEGATTIGVLYVPAGRPVRLLMTSRDVIHSFYVPDFRVKQDVVPGTVTRLWFQADAAGRHDVFCAEYCGTGHSMMRAAVVVLPADEYAGFLRAGLGQTGMVEQGRLAAARHGCLRCHSVDGSPHIGPSWAFAYGATRRFADGSSAVVDEAYLTASMMDPRRQVVAGYAPVMPPYQGLLAPGDAAAIVEYIKSLAHERGALPVPPAVPVPPAGPAFVPAEAR